MNQVAHHTKPWQLLVSVCLTRANTLSRKLTDMEERYANLQLSTEFERAIHNDYEMEKINLKKETQLTNGKKKTTEEEENKVTAAKNKLLAIQETEDRWESFASSINLPAYENHDNDMTSLFRRRHDCLHYTVKDNGALMKEDGGNVYPYSPLQPNETLSQAARRLLESHGLNNCRMFSNAPIGVLKVPYSKNEKRGQQFQGAKTPSSKMSLRMG